MQVRATRRRVHEVGEALLLHQPSQGQDEEPALGHPEGKADVRPRSRDVVVAGANASSVDAVGHEPGALGPRPQAQRPLAQVAAAGGDGPRGGQGGAAEDARGKEALGEEHVAAVQAHHEGHVMGAHEVGHQGRVRHQPVRVDDVVALGREALRERAAEGEGHERGEQEHRAPHAHVALQALRVAPEAPRLAGRVPVGEEAHGLVPAPAQLGMVGQDHVHLVSRPRHAPRDLLDEGRGHVPRELGVRGRDHEDLHRPAVPSGRASARFLGRKP